MGNIRSHQMTNPNLGAATQTKDCEERQFPIKILIYLDNFQTCNTEFRKFPIRMGSLLLLVTIKVCFLRKCVAFLLSLIKKSSLENCFLTNVAYMIIMHKQESFLSAQKISKV